MNPLFKFINVNLYKNFLLKIIKSISKIFSKYILHNVKKYSKNINFCSYSYKCLRDDKSNYFYIYFSSISSKIYSKIYFFYFSQNIFKIFINTYLQALYYL